MILEVADVFVTPGSQSEFEQAVHKAVSVVFNNAKGFLGLEMQHGIDQPERYLLLIKWETLENHTVDFRESDLFQEWRKLASGYFARAPLVEHFELSN